MRWFVLALKMLWRDARAGELTLLVLALLIAVTASTTISLFADRLQRTMSLQAAEFLAGDMALATSAAIPADWLQQAQSLGLQQADTTEFSSVLLENNQMLLAAVKAVSSHYPLRGQLKISDQDLNNETQLQHGPQPDTAWVEQRVLSALNLTLGDKLVVGERSLRITQVLRYEPDKRGDFYSFSPRVMINRADLVATGVIQPGSQVRYGYQFIGGETALEAFKQWLKPQLNPSQRILDIHQDRPELGSALQRAEHYLGLSSVVVILISGVAIAMAAGRYSQRHFNAAALLRCLGSQQQNIVLLFSAQFVLLGGLTSLLGCGLGWLGQAGLFYLLGELLPAQLANPSSWALVLGFATGMLILLGFALPPLLRLQKVSPLRVLRRELEPVPNSVWLVYGLALAILALLIWRYSTDWQMTASIVGIGMLVLAVLAVLVMGVLTWSKRWLPYLSLSGRFALQGLLRNRQVSISQILAFSITLAAMVLSFTVRNDLIDSWQQQLPENAPNHFALNIFADKLTAFQADLQQANINSSPFYPVIKGRLVAVNDEPVQKRVSKDSKGEAATQRELSLTWADKLPVDNLITAGSDWQAGQMGLVSVEQKLADNLGIKVGDTLRFTVGSEQLTASVANLRSLQWDTMKPNFYMIFSPGSLEGFPATYMSSFYLAESQKPLLTALIKKYPATTVLEVDQVLKQFKTILSQLTQAIDYLLYFALLAGFMVLFTAAYASLDQRIIQGALMRTLGANSRFLIKIQWLEFGLLGAVSGFLAVLLSESVRAVLYVKLIQIDYHPNWLVGWLLPIIGLISVGLAGYWGVRRVVKLSPMRILRQFS